jgi:hypothetical protein
MESDIFKQLTHTRGALRLAISVIRKMRARQKVDSQAAVTILARTLVEARETARKHTASPRPLRNGRN